MALSWFLSKPEGGGRLGTDPLNRESGNRKTGALGEIDRSGPLLAKEVGAPGTIKCP